MPDGLRLGYAKEIPMELCMFDRWSRRGDGPRIRMLGCALVALLSLSGGSSFAQTAPAKGKKPATAKGKKGIAPGPKDPKLSAALQEKGQAVQQCMIDNAMERGAAKVDVDVRVTIESTGAVADSQVTVKVQWGDDAKLGEPERKDAQAKAQECVEQLVNATKFPTVKTRLATAERTWTVAAQ